MDLHLIIFLYIPRIRTKQGEVPFSFYGSNMWNKHLKAKLLFDLNLGLKFII